MRRTMIRRFLSFTTALAALSTAAFAQRAETRPVTAADYAHAEQFLGYNTTPLVLHAFAGAVRPTWLKGAQDRVWYVARTEQGIEAFLVDAASRTRVPCDLAECKEAIARAARSDTAARRPTRTDAPSPDGKRAAFIRDWNLWIRDTATGNETQLTTDGVKDFGYGTDNAGWTRSDRPVVVWSPDSKKIATFQQDQRGTGEMYLVDTRVGHPKLEAWKYPLPGDPTVTMIHRVVIDVDGRRFVRLQTPPDQHRSTLCDDIECRGEGIDIQWSPDASHAAFVSTS